MNPGKIRAEVCLSPRLAETYDVRDRIVIIVDILRATSCWVTALSNGAAAIHPVNTLEECKVLMNHGYMGAAERNGKKVGGFDLGNSPFEYTKEIVGGKGIAVTTTNGSNAVKSFKSARDIVIGSFLNFSALMDFIKKASKRVLIACAGWEGGISLEDVMFAGAFIERSGEDIIPEDDAAVMAFNLWKSAQPDFRNWLRKSSHVKRLLKLGLEKDIEYCFNLNLTTMVPRLVGTEIIIPSK